GAPPAVAWGRPPTVGRMEEVAMKPLPGSGAHRARVPRRTDLPRASRSGGRELKGAKKAVGSGGIMANQIVWCDIPVLNLDRAVRFYSAVLGGEVRKVEIGGTTVGIL